jgi:hypothetical protein
LNEVELPERRRNPWLELNVGKKKKEEEEGLSLKEQLAGRLFQVLS